MSDDQQLKGGARQMPDTPGRKDDDPESPKSLDKSGSDLPDLLSEIAALYNKDRSWGPLAAAMKEQDSPADSAPDLTSKAWRDALPGLQADWKHHLERWPEAERPSVDQSRDEEGSWRGDGLPYLNADENSVADKVLGRARETEKSVTASVKAIEAEVPGAQLVGLDNCLKDADRFKEKTYYEMQAKSAKSIDQITSDIPDVIRYTYQFDAESYTKGYGETCSKLKQQGYTMETCWNSWADSQYRGVNTRWQEEKSGQRFEVQFHTPDSFSAKQLTHPAFERLRIPVEDDDLDPERDDLKKFQRKVTAAIPQPAGALSIENYPLRRINDH